ncbi:MAG: hypothetical protein SYC29_16475 [Planctomycetota bacterium]|nr:hypothetical protein [Planctomycetota bacterium]
MRRIADPTAWLDPGWLFVIAGLAMCAAAILVPAQSDLARLRRQLAELRDEETMLAERLRAHAAFLDDLHEADPALVKRLAAAQLNLVPHGERPVLMVRSTSASVGDWIESTVRAGRIERPERPASVLSRLTDARRRLWVLGGSIFCVFVGLLPGPTAGRRRQAEATEDGTAPEKDESPISRRNTAKAARSPIVRPAVAGPVVAPSAPEEEGPSAAAGAAAPVAGAAAEPSACEPEADGSLMISDVEDEADVLDEDEPQPPGHDEAGGDDSVADAAAPAKAPGREIEAEEPDPNPGDEDDEEWVYEDEVAADAAAEGDDDDDDDDDDEYEYEYEYVYVDEEEGEGEDAGDDWEDDEDED